MNTLARNFSHTFRRFFTASVLNIIGLAIAFASFFVIMTQVDYDLNFNKGYKDYQNIYRVEVYPNDDNGWQTWMARPLCELISSSSPHIQALTIVSSFSEKWNTKSTDTHSGKRPLPDSATLWRHSSLK